MSQPRRSPRGDERKRDPERTRERLIEAAAEEFGEHGFAGARISAIASRAGVNQQLISYYFDGKEGLYRALRERWSAISGGINRPDAPLTEIVAEYVRLNRERRAWARALVWEGMADGADKGDPAFFQAMVDDMRRRQGAGELAEDLDPAYVLLAIFAAGLAPTVIPQVARHFTGLEPDSEEFEQKYAEQLARILGRLAPPTKDPAARADDPAAQAEGPAGAGEK